MIEVKGNILSDEILSQACAVCFTSNGVIKKDKSLAMGEGVAKAFRNKFPHLDTLAGAVVENRGNICQTIIDLKIPLQWEIRDQLPPQNRLFIVAFPTKHHWKDNSDINLIKKSAVELKELADQNEWKKVYLPRPGCRNGHLNWNDVKSVIAPILDDRFFIITL